MLSCAQTGRPWLPPLPHGAVVVFGDLRRGWRAGGDGVSDKTARVWNARTGGPVGAPLGMTTS